MESFAFLPGSSSLLRLRYSSTFPVAPNQCQWPKHHLRCAHTLLKPATATTATCLHKPTTAAATTDLWQAAPGPRRSPPPLLGRTRAAPSAEEKRPLHDGSRPLDDKSCNGAHGSEGPILGSPPCGGSVDGSSPEATAAKLLINAATGPPSSAKYSTAAAAAAAAETSTTAATAATAPTPRARVQDALAAEGVYSTAASDSPSAVVGHGCRRQPRTASNGLDGLEV